MSLTKSVRLADQDAALPLPGVPGAFAPKGAFTINVIDPFWSLCLADGSVVAAPDVEPAPLAKSTKN